MTVTKTRSPDVLMLAALESELLGLPRQGGINLGAWAGEVADHLRVLWPERAANSQAVLGTAARALRDIMCSGSCHYLLEDAFNRPRVFARTLGIMMGDQAPFMKAGLMQ